MTFGLGMLCKAEVQRCEAGFRSVSAVSLNGKQTFLQTFIECAELKERCHCRDDSLPGGVIQCFLLLLLLWVFTGSSFVLCMRCQFCC